MRRTIGCAFLVLVALCVTFPAALLIMSGGPDGVSTFIDQLAGDAPPEGGQTWAKVGGPAPTFRLASLDGKIIDIGELRGQPMLINFWATWCGPCQNEMPAIEEAHKRYGKQVRFLAVNVEESAGQADSFIKARGLTFQVLLDSQGAVSKTYRVRALPSTFFVDRDGKLVEQYTGEMNRSVIDRRVKSLTEQ